MSTPPVDGELEPPPPPEDGDFVPPPIPVGRGAEFAPPEDSVPAGEDGITFDLLMSDGSAALTFLSRLLLKPALTGLGAPLNP